MLTRLPTLLALLFLAGCAALPPDPVLANPVGLSEAELVARLGVPLGSYEVEARRFLTYERMGSAPAVTPSIGLGIGGFGGGWGSGTAVGTGLGLTFGGRAATCLTTYELRGGSVVGLTRQGQGCD